jgi:hypothetical protein
MNVSSLYESLFVKPQVHAEHRFVHYVSVYEYFGLPYKLLRYYFNLFFVSNNYLSFPFHSSVDSNNR